MVLEAMFEWTPVFCGYVYEVHIARLARPHAEHDCDTYQDQSAWSATIRPRLSNSSPSDALSASRASSATRHGYGNTPTYRTHL